MLSALFISDLHIENMSDPKALTLLGLLKSMNSKEHGQLFLMGDIFDFWIGDHEYFVREYQPLIAEFTRLKREGITLHYFEGNHDLHLKKFWHDQLGFEVHSDPIYLKIGNYDLRLEHGDQMDPSDKGYLFLRWLLRTKPIKWLAHHLPGRVVAEIGQRSSQTSRSYTSEVKKISEDQARRKVQLHAENAYLTKAFHLIISGHVHVRDHYKLTSGAESWNLGTWLTEPGYLEFRDGKSVWKNLELKNA